MDIKSCKKCIEDKVKINNFLIFKEPKTDFVSRQYIQEIAKINNQEIEYIDDIEAHIEGEYEPEEFINLSYDEQYDLVKAAVADNSEAIFGKNIFE